MLSTVMVSHALRAAGIVGTWQTDVAAGRSYLNEDAAAFLTGDAGLAGCALTLDEVFRRIHPEDRQWVFAWIHRVRQTGGPVSAEFRILNERGEIRWILNRGYLACDEAGAMHGTGTYIDTTDNHQGSFLRQSTDADPLHIAAEHCIQAHAAVRQTGDGYLHHLTSMLLLAIGRLLAAR